MWNRNGSRMSRKTLNFLRHLFISMCVLMTMAQSVFSDINNELDETLIIEEKGDTHRKARCKSELFNRFI